MKSVRDIEVKTRLNLSEFVAFRDKCAAAGVAQSAAIRAMTQECEITPIASRVRRKNDIYRPPTKEGPVADPNRARFFPGRKVNYGRARMSMQI